MHLGRMFSKKERKGKGWLMRQKEELIWDRRGAERRHGTRSTAIDISWGQDQKRGIYTNWLRPMRVISLHNNT